MGRPHQHSISSARGLISASLIVMALGFSIAQVAMAQVLPFGDVSDKVRGYCNGVFLEINREFSTNPLSVISGSHSSFTGNYAYVLKEAPDSGEWVFRINAQGTEDISECVKKIGPALKERSQAQDLFSPNFIDFASYRRIDGSTELLKVTCIYSLYSENHAVGELVIEKLW